MTAGSGVTLNGQLVADSIRVLQVGLGYIGLAVTKILSARNGYQITGAVDVDPAKSGADLGTLAGLWAPLNVGVQTTVETALAEAPAEAAVLATTSGMADITPQILELVAHGLNIVSTCEELVYPWRSHGELAGQIDTAARQKGVTVLATGVNPGFLMDFLPLMVSRMVGTIERIAVDRILDAGNRREAFQHKIGAGLTVAAFEQRVTTGNFGHAGLTASMELLAAGLGWSLDDTSVTIEPVLAQTALRTEFLTIHAGAVAGVRQVGRGRVGGREALTLTFQAAVGEPRSSDTIRIAGEPPLELTFPGGVPGDAATGAITVNALPHVMQAPPGLLTMANLWAVR